MKKRIQIISIHVLLIALAACGLNRGRKSALTDSNPNTGLQREFHINNKLIGNPNTSQEVPGHLILGRFERSQLPQGLQNLGNGAKIGKLELEIEKTTFKTSYEEDAVPEKTQSSVDTGLDAFLFAEAPHFQVVVIAIQDTQNNRRLLNTTEPIEVLSKFRLRCLRIDIARDTDSNTCAQTVKCDEHENCLYEVCLSHHHCGFVTQKPSEILQMFPRLGCGEEKIVPTQRAFMDNRRRALSAKIWIDPYYEELAEKSMVFEL